MRYKTLVILGAALAGVAALLFFVRPSRLLQPRLQLDPALESALIGVTQDYRKIIVLMDGADALDDARRERCLAAGRQIFWRKQRAIDDLDRRFTEHANANDLRQLIQYLSAGSLHDADKLAFLDLVEEIASPGAGRNPVDAALKSLLINLQSIQLTYREEVTRIFSQFATRGAAGTREKWDAYVATLRQQLTRDRILAEFGDTLPVEPPPEMRGAAPNPNEIFGNEFAPKTVALTFDDGPHPKYTELVLALLRKYGIRASFFEVGISLGTVDAAGKVTLSKNAEISKKVLEAGHVIANHSYSHPVLPKLPEAQRTEEIEHTNLLLAQILGHKPELFRPPYGARNQAILQEVVTDGLKSVMWNIDSLDWADPIPESIAMRVLHALNQTQKGVILFHDIHKQGVMALTPVIEELQRQEYTFLAYDHGKFSPSALKPETDRSAPAVTQATPLNAPGPEAKSSLYRESWAVVIGINDYQNWPKLRYAVNDATSIDEVLVSKFGFQPDHIRKLLNGDATRTRIMQVLGDEFTDPNKVQREDRVFFFFAGHGATRTMGDGRQIGFIVPVDADRENYYSTAISMTQLREATDLIAAKHIYFVMDSCYSGLALSRGAGAFSKDRSYLEEITRRTSRQILTAGGADQQVADDGPNGHSVFTWALLQGLQGQADLDGNGFITASELGSYISPVVASLSKQTPTVGNLVGSEGGEFIFELRPEPLTSLSRQMDGQALQLTGQLATLQKEIAAKQAELLRLQQSVQAESTRLTQLTRSAATPPAPARPKANQAYDLDRQGQQLYREKKYDEALQKFQQAVDLKPGDAVLLNNLGFLYYRMSRYDDALAYLQKTLAADPKRKEAYGNIADVFLKMGRKEDARQNYQRYLELFPNSPRAEEVRRIVKTL
jgi:peptidoglycan/xylan/chitin deacetylase (PgdA/CDA1 family)/tetratricopeptide (TPR) repeat protein